MSAGRRVASGRRVAGPWGGRPRRRSVERAAGDAVAACAFIESQASDRLPPDEAGQSWSGRQAGADSRLQHVSLRVCCDRVFRVGAAGPQCDSERGACGKHPRPGERSAPTCCGLTPADRRGRVRGRRASFRPPGTELMKLSHLGRERAWLDRRRAGPGRLDPSGAGWVGRGVPRAFSRRRSRPPLVAPTQHRLIRPPQGLFLGISGAGEGRKLFMVRHHASRTLIARPSFPQWPRLVRSQLSANVRNKGWFEGVRSQTLAYLMAAGPVSWIGFEGGRRPRRSRHRVGAYAMVAA